MLSAVLASLLALTLSSPAASASTGFEACDRLAASQPEAEATAKCYDDEGTRLKQPAAEAARLRDLLRRFPGSPWPAFYLSFVDTDHTAELTRAAAAGFAARHDAGGEVRARGNIYRLLYNAGRVDEAGMEAERATRVAEASHQPELIARARILQARQLWSTGKDLEQAHMLLRQAESSLFPSGNYYVRRDCLSALGNLGLELGRYREGSEAFRRMAVLAAAQHDAFAEANALYGMTRGQLDQLTEIPSEEGRRAALTLAQQSLDSAVAAKNRSIQAKAHWALAVLSKGDEARRHLDACLATADTARDQSYCLNARARFLAPTDPRGAQEATDRSLALARQSQDYWSMAFAWRERMRVSWATGARERAVEASRSVLDAVEALRDLQAATSGKVEAFSTWSEDYYWLSGRLIEAAQSGGGPEDLDRAFLVAERLRARSLVDTLEAAHAVPAGALPIQERRSAVLEQISGVQRQLLNPDLPTGGRTEAIKGLEALEMQEADLRHQLARAAPALVSPRRPDFATLSRVRQALAPDEALLAFQIAPWEDERGDFAGGSWLSVTTRSGTRIYRLPGRGELRSAVHLFTGMFDRRDGSEAAPAASLYRQLLEKPLAELPPGIRRLRIIADDALHQLAFAALRATAKAPPLGVRFELTEIPSATLWLGWKGDRPPAAQIPALALADPPLPGDVAGHPQVAAATERAAIFASGVRLGPLPYARRESGSVVDEMGGGSVRRLGEDASEAWLKSAPLQRFGVLHFATHAVTDEAHPERSGVLLAPGAASQDGLLQIREIVDLDLRGRVVVLSACSSNTGVVLRGEGVMSLARAFFQAGAHTVVASLWRLRDDEAADFFDRYYKHLGHGRSVAAAAQAARKDLIAQGAPAAAWAGIVVLGDGDLVPLPGGRKGWNVPVWAWALGAIGSAAVIVLWVLVRSKEARRLPSTARPAS
ncbi:MAG TPA: CHAT domain-containing protein [Thermoanaerobaculia bacterium]|jgi:CHAT domain-containing protein|nr:CHAT domain-containing protein [Thermoanaerobaculia bacterium]